MSASQTAGPSRRRRSRRRLDDQHAALRRLTWMAAIVATFLNGILFAQAGHEYFSMGDLQQSALQILGAVFPGGPEDIQRGAAPSPSPRGTQPVVVSGGS